MKLLTFLGTGKYTPTCYTWQEQQFETAFAPAAACQFLKPDQLVVFLTDEVRAGDSFEDFKAALPSDLPLKLVSIPLGKDEGELWQIFDRVSEQVAPGESVAFDITHGLRSFPLIGLLAAAFLRAGLDVSIQAVLYGAYDVGKALGQGYTPMFDLSSMLVLLEWAIAADRFNRTGDARYLASLVQEQRKNLALQAQGDPQALSEVGQLGNLAGALTSISNSLRTNRPRQAMEQVARLPGSVDRAQTALERAASALPFSLLLERVSLSFSPLAQPDPGSAEYERSAVDTERRMIHWYAEREQWVQAVSLAREWLLNWIMIHIGVPDLTQLSARQRVEGVVNSEAHEYKQAKSNGKPFAPVFLAALPEAEAALKLWLSLTDVRNDIAHAGYREDPGKPDDLIARIKTCLAQIDELPL